MNPELVIFDCDGVLIDSEIIACRVDARELTALGIPTSTEEIIQRFSGVSPKDQWAAIERDIGRSLPEDFEGRVARQVELALAAELRCIPGVHEAVARLPVPFCIASSSSPHRLRHALTLTGLFDLFSPNIFSTTEVANGKPAPDLFLYAAERMGVAPSRCLVVEDSATGIKAAAAAGMYPVGFTGGSHCGPGHAGWLRREGAQFVINGFEDLSLLVSAQPSQRELG